VDIEMERTLRTYDYASPGRVFLGRAVVVCEGNLAAGPTPGVGATEAAATSEDHFGVVPIGDTDMVEIDKVLFASRERQ
jgi:hypothetical protein